MYIYIESAVTAAKSELSHQTWIQKWSNPCSSSKHLVLLCQNFAPRNKCQLIIIWFSHVVSKELPHCSKPRNKPYPPSGCVWKCGIPKNSNFQGEVMVKPLDSGASDFWRNPSYVEECFNQAETHGDFLKVVAGFNPSEKYDMSLSVGIMTFPTEWKVMSSSHVPHHQAVIINHY